MISRLLDYALVALVLLALYGLFRLSRLLLARFLEAFSKRRGPLSDDSVLLLGFYSLLAGLSLLPIITWGLAFVDSDMLLGGMPLHLVLVAVSVVLFSFSEDLYGSHRKYAPGRWSLARHARLASPPLMAFWVLGSLLLSPIFYSGLTIILAVFYAYALRCRA